MTELTFLMELFLEDEMPKEIKKKIVHRLRDVEAEMGQAFAPQQTRGVAPLPIHQADNAFAGQAPSMQRLMQQNPDIIPKPPQPITQAAAQALAARQALLNGAANEKPEPGRNSKRKI